MEREDDVADMLARTLAVLQAQGEGSDPARSAKMASLQINLLAVSAPGDFTVRAH